VFKTLKEKAGKILVVEVKEIAKKWSDGGLSNI
jgi:hypothetical protein